MASPGFMVFSAPYSFVCRDCFMEENRSEAGEGFAGFRTLETAQSLPTRVMASPCSLSSMPVCPARR